MVTLIGVAVVAAALGLFLWGNSCPGLSEAAGKYYVSGCEQPRDKNAVRVCPKLYCEKALRESGHPMAVADIAFKE